MLSKINVSQSLLKKYDNNSTSMVTTDMSIIRRSSNIRRFFLFQILEKIIFAMPLKERFKMDSEEKDGSDVKRQVSDVEKPVFCSVFFNFKLCSYCQIATKKSDFSIFENIKSYRKFFVYVSL